METDRQVPILQTPPILIVDGVWVDVQYTLNTFKLDWPGYQRAYRKVQERVILVAMAVWDDGSYHVLQHEAAKTEDELAWMTFFDHLLQRGLDSQVLYLVVSDGSNGLSAAIQQRLPKTQQQRCITHKTLDAEHYLNYRQLSPQDADSHVLKQQTAKDQVRFEFRKDAYSIYQADCYDKAHLRLQTFIDKWEALQPIAVHTLACGINQTFTFYQFDPSLHLHIGSTILLKRLFRAFRAQSDESGAFPNEQSF